MILGQIKDLEGEANPGIDHAGLQVIHYYKTGRLLSLPLVCAALLAGHRGCSGMGAHWRRYRIILPDSG